RHRAERVPVLLPGGGGVRRATALRRQLVFEDHRGSKRVTAAVEHAEHEAGLAIPRAGVAGALEIDAVRDREHAERGLLQIELARARSRDGRTRRAATRDEPG